MKKAVLIAMMVLLPLVVYGQEVIEKIELVGNELVTEDTVLYYLTFKEGDYFNKDSLQDGFKVLWATGYFSDIKIEAVDGEKGKVIRVYVKENPIIKKITYKTGKRIKEKDIVDKLKEENVNILPYSYYRPYSIRRIEDTIKSIMEEKGLAAGKVKTEVKNRGKNEVEIIFNVDAGRKIRIGDVVFEGEPKLRESTLMNALKENKEHSFISWASGKDTFKQDQLESDVSNLVEKYKEHGFMEAQVGEPVVKEIEKRSIFFKKQTMKQIIIPVDAGYLYFVGDVTIEGNEFFNAKNLRTLIPMREGNIYSIDDREKGVEEISKLYQNFGYMYVRIIPVERLDPKNKKVNVTYNIVEGPVAYIHRMEFKGNTYTNDKVMRREMMIREGNRFSYDMFKNSLLRINQLGLVEIKQDPNIYPDPQDPTKVDVTINVTELQRNNIQFSAGYSGYQGAFVSLSYSTVNFLGAGEKLELTATYGKRTKIYSFGFTEPYIFDLPLNAGFNIYDRYIVYPGLFNRKGRGINVHLGGRVRGYWRARLSYGLEFLEMSEYEGEEGDDYYSNLYYSMYGYNYNYYPYYYGGPLIGNTSLGFHVEYKFINSIGDSAIPYWERFYLGGERSIRGYDIYTIGPRSMEGYNMGGVKSLVFNAEYIIPLGGPVYAILFYDRGNAYSSEQKIDINNMYSSAGLEARVFVPALRVPFRLIFSYNNRISRTGDSNFKFRFAIGTTF